MWARDVEVMLACWLAISPLVFRQDAGPWLWWNDLICAGLVLVLALLSYVRGFGRAHILILLVVAWLIGHGWWTGWSGEPTPTSQNHIITGLLLAMIAIVPSHALDPPRAWRERGAHRRRSI